MKSLIHNIINRLLRYFSLRIVKAPFHPQALKNIQERVILQPECKCVYVGCGDDSIEGFVGSDLRNTDAADIICPAWKLSEYANNLECIYSRHMLEHLTFEQAIVTLSDWFRTLRPSGEVVICVPNLEFHAHKLGILSDEEIKNWDGILTKNCKVSEALSGFFGWQRESSPTLSLEDIANWDIHKSGYTVQILTKVLDMVGFVEIQTTIEQEKHLIATARKPI